MLIPFQTDRWRPPAPALAGPGWQIPDQTLSRYCPAYHLPGIRAAVRELEAGMDDRTAWARYREAAKTPLPSEPDTSPTGTPPVLFD